MEGGDAAGDELAGSPSTGDGVSRREVTAGFGSQAAGLDATVGA